jgi:hypothetical protein
MRKITALKVEELHKRYSDKTTAVCTTDGYVDSEGVANSREHPLHIEFDDKFAPELGQRLLVIIEDIPALGDRHGTPDPLKTYIEQRKQELDGAKKVENGRKFR